jgi:CHAD domain-containing protein
MNCGESIVASAVEPITAAEPISIPNGVVSSPDGEMLASSDTEAVLKKQPSGFGRVRVVDKELYLQNARRTRKAFSKRIRAYLKDPSPDNVHDLRTAARRTRACLQLLPRNPRRRRRIREYSSTLKELIRVNAGVRDADIIVSKISQRKDASTYQQLTSQLGKMRATDLKLAISYVSSVENPPRGLVQTEDLSDELLQERFDRVTRKLEDRIRERLPVVLENPAKKRALHRLREDSRRLRYVLDLGGTPAEKEPMPLLRSWQDILGLIHDSDIMIDRLRRGRPSAEIQDLLRSEVAERNLNYEKFASMPTTRLALRLTANRGRKAARRLAR